MRVTWKKREGKRGENGRSAVHTIVYRMWCETPRTITVMPPHECSNQLCRRGHK